MIKMDTKNFEGTQILEKNTMRQSKIMTETWAFWAKIFFCLVPAAITLLNQQFSLGQML